MCRCTGHPNPTLNDTLIREQIDCSTIHLKNNYLLYYQYNCDSIWLTLESTRKKKTVLFSMNTMHYAYTYRLGCQLQKERSRTLLFRCGCPANGPCTYRVIDKYTGRQLRKYTAY